MGTGKEAIQSMDDLPWINVEWLNKLGLSMPTTTKELKQVLIAFKTKDPNGNGQADEIFAGAEQSGATGMVANQTGGL
ncbi:sugar ABC transporter periplasmic protein [Paenibacillus terrae HPL-003]|uniref:Sugar ABC transporter periplasmic protein n=1 Tax=Paenibacillus terrae (strain HPL-003) TaxID=985665 RepID=G7VWG5_PAETH|nr:sugar ABC transporter periplasmic protein [Paenibacillus terrae HPL-003]